MARKGQGIEIVSGWQEGLGGEDFLRDLVQRTVQQVLDSYRRIRKQEYFVRRDKPVLFSGR